MDYEKKYKEVLERVRRLHDRMLFLSSTDALVASNELEFIFPELRESEDMDGDTDTYFDDLRNHLPAGSGLRKEYKEYVEDDPVFRKLTNRNVGFAIARHFYELGLKSK